MLAVNILELKWDGYISYETVTQEDFHNLLLFFTTGIWLLFPMLKRRVVFHLNSLQTLMLCAKFVWKWTDKTHQENICDNFLLNWNLS